MVRTRIIAVSLGGGLAIVGGVLAWQGWLPGLPALKPHAAAQAPLPAKTAPAKAVATAAPAASVMPKKVEPSVGAAKPPQQAVKPPQTAAVASTAPTPATPAPNVAAAAPPPIVPRFDTVRVEPSGESVIAGHAAPGAKIDLMAGDKVVGQVKADDASGDFVIVPKALAPGNYLLALRSRSSTDAPVQSRQTITVVVPAKGQKDVVVALTEPGKASVLLTDPTTKPAAKPAATPAPQPAGAKTATQQGSEAPAVPSVAFKTVEVGKGSFYTTGLAAPGTHLQIYMNGSRVADVVADAAGHWSMRIGKGVVAGHYTVRADAIDAAGKVVARAEVPFDMQAVEAQLEDKAAPAPKPEPESKDLNSASAPAAIEAPKSVAPQAAEPEPKPAPAAPVKLATAAPQATPSTAVVEISTATVAPGDSLWRISRKAFGRGIRYLLIYAANASQIRDPNLIYPGQVFVVPHADH